MFEFKPIELELADLLCAQLRGRAFDPSRYVDPRRLALSDAVEKKIAGNADVAVNAAPKRRVIDLLGALRERVRATTADGRKA